MCQHMWHFIILKALNQLISRPVLPTTDHVTCMGFMVGWVFIYQIKVLLFLCHTHNFPKDKILMNKAFEALEGLNNVTFESIPGAW